MINRFTKINPTTYQDVGFYTPNFEAWDQVLGQQQSSIDEANLMSQLGFNYRDVDKDAAGKYNQFRQSEMESIANIYKDQGTAAGNRALRNYKTRIQADFMPGGVAHTMSANYDIEQKQRESILASGHSKGTKDWMLNNTLDNTATIQADAEGRYNFTDRVNLNRINQRPIVDNVDLAGWMLEAGKNVKSLGWSNWKMDGKNADGTPRIVEENGTIVPRWKIRESLMGLAASSPHIQEYLGFFNEMDPNSSKGNEMFDSALNGAIETFFMSNSKTTTKSSGTTRKTRTQKEEELSLQPGKDVKVGVQFSDRFNANTLGGLHKEIQTSAKQLAETSKQNLLALINTATSNLGVELDETDFPTIMDRQEIVSANGTIVPDLPALDFNKDQLLTNVLAKKEANLGRELTDKELQVTRNQVQSLWDGPISQYIAEERRNELDFHNKQSSVNLLDSRVKEELGEGYSDYVSQREKRYNEVLNDEELTTRREGEPMTISGERNPNAYRKLGFEGSDLEERERRAEEAGDAVLQKALGPEKYKKFKEMFETLDGMVQQSTSAYLPWKTNTQRAAEVNVVKSDFSTSGDSGNIVFATDNKPASEAEIRAIGQLMASADSDNIHMAYFKNPNTNEWATMVSIVSLDDEGVLQVAREFDVNPNQIVDATGAARFIMPANEGVVKRLESSGLFDIARDNVVNDVASTIGNGPGFATYKSPNFNYEFTRQYDRTAKTVVQASIGGFNFTFQDNNQAGMFVADVELIKGMSDKDYSTEDTTPEQVAEYTQQIKTNAVSTLQTKYNIGAESAKMLVDQIFDNSLVNASNIPDVELSPDNLSSVIPGASLKNNNINIKDLDKNFVSELAEISPELGDFVITSGLRTLEEQKALYEGAEQNMPKNSKHLEGKAIDVRSTPALKERMEALVGGEIKEDVPYSLSHMGTNIRILYHKLSNNEYHFDIAYEG